MLPDIAEGLAGEALKKNSQSLVDEARVALKNASNVMYVPKNLRQESKLADAEDKLAITVRNIARGNELDKTVATMLASAKAAKTAAGLCGLQRPVASISQAGRRSQAQRRRC